MTPLSACPINFISFEMEAVKGYLDALGFQIYLDDLQLTFLLLWQVGNRKVLNESTEC